MAAKRGKGGKFVKGGGKSKPRKRRSAAKGGGASALLKSISKTVKRIDHTVNPGRWERIKGKKRAREEESELAAKYG